MAGITLVNLPDGQTLLAPVDPRTWSVGDRFRAKQLNVEVGAAIAWHRQRTFFQGLQTVSQAIALATWTELDIDWELRDTNGGHNDPSNVSYWNAPATAFLADNFNVYLCIGFVPSAAQASNTVVTGIIKNDTEVHEGTKHTTTAAHAITGMAVDLVGLGPSDWVSLAAYSAATTSSTVVSTKSPSLSVRWVAASAGHLTSQPATPHTWVPHDQVTADATGSSPESGGVKVPLNREIRDTIRFLNYPPFARLTAEGGTQSIASSATAWTALKFPLQNLDSYSGWSSSANTKYTFQRDGLYFVGGYYSSVETTSSVGYRAVRLQVNGDANKVYGGTSIDAIDTSGTGSAIYATHLIRVVAGDYVETQVQQNNGSALAVKVGAGDTCKMVVSWMSE